MTNGANDSRTDSLFLSSPFSRIANGKIPLVGTQSFLSFSVANWAIDRRVDDRSSSEIFQVK